MTAILKVDTIQDTSGNNIINESSDTITIGASGDTTNIVGTLQNNGAAVASTNGITVADQWRLASDYTYTGSGDLDSNLEQVDGNGQGTLGTAMSESSGIFTFPSTGIWLVKFNATKFYNGDRRSSYISILNTTDNSSYTTRAQAVTHIKQSESNTTYIQGQTETLLDITDTSNHKVKFQVFTSATTRGSTNENRTFFTFIRLGDT